MDIIQLNFRRIVGFRVIHEDLDDTPGVLCLPCFWTISVLFGFGILYVASWTMEIQRGEIPLF